MKNPETPVWIVTVILLVYTVLAVFGINADAVIIIFLFSPLLVIWMVLSVLKSKEQSTRTFDEYFYDDADIKRSGKE